jgi:uncharacterized protein (TIGR03084 family)
MESVLTALAAQQEELTDLLTDLDADGWAQASACEGWTVADVVLHLAQTNEMATGSARGDFDGALTRLTEGLPPIAGNVDEGAGLMVDHQRGAAPQELLERWTRSCADLREALRSRSPADRITWVAGEMAARTLASTRLAETWIHTGDVADGLGVALEPDDRLWHVARLAWRTIPYAFARAGRAAPGPVSFELVAPSGASWSFAEDGTPADTVVRGPAHDLCRLAGQRADPAHTDLVAEGSDAAAVLELVRTYA